jgi:hypothetical protein
MEVYRAVTDTNLLLLMQSISGFGQFSSQPELNPSSRKNLTDHKLAAFQRFEKYRYCLKKVSVSAGKKVNFLLCSLTYL